jgi:hypothetical protein
VNASVRRPRRAVFSRVVDRFFRDRIGFFETIPVQEVSTCPPPPPIKTLDELKLPLATAMAPMLLPIETSYALLNGFKTSTRNISKSRTLRVTTTSPRTRAVAAIIASSSR